MAGKELGDFLGSGDYDRFYELYHGMGEAMLGRCSNIHIAFYALQQLLAYDSESDPSAQVKEDIQEGVLLAEEMELALRRFYWPKTSQDIKEKIAHSMERWKPYDAVAWDEMFAQQSAVIYPFVQSIWLKYEKIITHPFDSSSESAESIREIIKNLGHKLNILKRWCTTEELEYMLFHPHDYIQGRSPYGEI